MYTSKIIKKDETMHPGISGGKFAEFQDAVIVFDLGGTYFRSGLYLAYEGLSEIRQQPAFSFHSAPNKSIADLKQDLVDYLVKTALYYSHRFNTNQVSISLGAALNGRNGIVYGSGPLWGNDNSSFDLLTLLRQAASELTWHIVNDVTAGLIHYGNNLQDTDIRKVLLLTISTGVACRLLDTRNQHIALDEFGLQGEIGHLPINLCFEGQALELGCDCGGRNHVAAFASGRGLRALSKLLAECKPVWWQSSKLAALQSHGLTFETALYQALEHNDEFANTLLYLTTQPIAEILRNALTLDPEIDRIVLTGGVVVNLSTYYRIFLTRHLSEQGIYLSSRFDPAFFERRLAIASSAEVNNLMGAALYATTYSKREYYA